MTSPEPAKNGNGKQKILATLAASGDKWVQFGILVLVGLSGFGNWVATQSNADRNRNEIEENRRISSQELDRLREQIRQQVADIHRWLSDSTEEFHRGNADSAANRKMIGQIMREDLQGFEDRQTKELENQTEILKYQNQILEEIRNIARIRSGGHP